MKSIDLIPADYRQRLTRLRWLRITAVACAATIIAAVSVTLGLARMTNSVDRTNTEIRLKAALNDQQKKEVEHLAGQISALDQELLLLKGLRSGASGEDLFRIVDRALPGNDVWFLDWRFRRAGVFIPEPARTVNTGYFIVVPAGEPKTEKMAWQVKTHMQINGQARDHAALSRFVRGLFEQPEVQDVKLDRTQTRQYANLTVVDFDLAVVLYSEPAA